MPKPKGFKIKWKTPTLWHGMQMWFPTYRRAPVKLRRPIRTIFKARGRMKIEQLRRSKALKVR